MSDHDWLNHWVLTVTMFGIAEEPPPEYPQSMGFRGSMYRGSNPDGEAVARAKRQLRQQHIQERLEQIQERLETLNRQ